MGTGLILGGGILLLLMMGGGPPKPPPGRKPIGKLKLPETDAELLALRNFLCACAEEVGSNPTIDKIVACALRKMFPDEAWPAAQGDDPTAFQLQSIVRDLSAKLLAAPTLEAFCNPGGGGGGGGGGGSDEPTPVDRLKDFLSEPGKPTPGTFYAVQQGDTAANIARRALNKVVSGSGDQGGDGKGGARRLDYIHCITSGPRWNMTLYATSDSSGNYPAYYLVNGVGLRRAFNPWHDAAKARIVAEEMPSRGVTPEGSKIAGVGSDYALLWLPPVDPQALAEMGIVTCAHTTWGDGSSSIDPPPEILNSLA